MSYTPPAYNQVYLSATTGTPPAYNEVYLTTSDSGNELNASLDMVWGDAPTYGADLEMIWGDTPPVEAELEMGWYSPVMADLEMVWPVYTVVEAYLLLPWYQPVEAEVVMPWGTAGLVEASLDLRWRDAYYAEASLGMNWLYPPILDASLAMVWPTLKVVDASMEMRWPVCGTTNDAPLEMVWDVNDYRLLESSLIMPWNGEVPSSSSDFAVGILVTGMKINNFESLSVSASIDEYVITITAACGDPAEFFPHQKLSDQLASMSEAEREAAISAATMVVTINELEFIGLLTGKNRRRESGISSYQLIAESKAILLDLPYALPISAAYGESLASTFCINLATAYGVTLVWQTVDWLIPNNTLYANDETPLALIRKISEAVGAVLQSDPDGTLRVMPYYPVTVPKWPSSVAAAYFVDGEVFAVDSEENSPRDGYNSFTVGTDLDSTDSLKLVEVAINSYKKEIHGFEVPWSGDVRNLLTSGGGWVVIESPQIVTKTVEGEEVEFINGSASLANPCYGMVSVDYGDNDNLGAVVFAEDGTMTAEVARQSLATVSYITKYWRWIVADPNSEKVQLYSFPASGDVPVTLVVTFGESVDTDAFVVAEGDDQLNVDDDGNVKSTFAPGDIFNFLLQHDDTVQVAAVKCSSGVVALLGEVARNKTVNQQFAATDDVELSYIPSGSVTAKWYGRSPKLTVNGRTISVDDYPAVADLNYSAAMLSYRLTPPAMSLDEDENYYILIVVEMEAV